MKNQLFLDSVILLDAIHSQTASFEVSEECWLDLQRFKKIIIRWENVFIFKSTKDVHQIKIKDAKENYKGEGKLVPIQAMSKLIQWPRSEVFQGNFRVMIFLSQLGR